MSSGSEKVRCNPDCPHRLSRLALPCTPTDIVRDTERSRNEHDWHEHRVVGEWPEEFPAEEIREAPYGNVEVIEDGLRQLHLIEECTTEDGGMRVLRVHPPLVWLSGHQVGVRF